MMNAAKVTLTATILAAAMGLALGLMAAPGNSYACHKDGAIHGNQTDCGGGGGGNDGGKDQMAASFDDTAAGIKSDGGGLYVNGEPGVDVKVGGPGRPIRIDLNSDGSQGDRFIMVHADCISPTLDCLADPISGAFPDFDDEWAVVDVLQAADMPADGKFYPKNATLQLETVDIGRLFFRFREPELFNPGGACSNQQGSTGAGASVWVARFEDGTWLVTTEDPAVGDLGVGLSTGDAGDVACLEVQTSANGTGFGGNYVIPFTVEVGPESVIAAP